MSEEKKLTIKQARFLQVYIETGNATEAAMQAYDCKDRDSARALGGENLAKLNIADLMEEKGLTDNRLLNKIDELLEASKTVSAVSGKDANAGTVDFVDVPDYQTQVKALDIALKLKSKYPKENKANIQINNFVPILGGKTANVHSNNSDQEVIEAQETN